ncbi:Cro/CI family transcriptional regulator [Enterobacter cloacae complex sp. CARB60]|uniref:Cro/CI family transcriptional regulator n=1 Tax=Enterobacter cloacae complex sp. CARB60 TaxID=3119569 RepID=UPI002F3FDFDD
MNKITLGEYVKEHGQVKAGEALGVTQIAISKALRAGREIFVVISEEGNVSAFENKAFPSKRRSNETRA